MTTRDPLENVDVDAMGAASKTLAVNPIRGVHTSYIGVDDHGVPTIFCVVRKKHPKLELASGVCIPRTVQGRDHGGSQEFKTKVIEAPQAEMRRLEGYTAHVVTGTHAAPKSASDMQRCHDFPIRGGVQIAPRSAGWVGTLGCACLKESKHGFLTNYHVAVGGQFSEGAAICQPHGSANQFAELHSWVPINFDGGSNRVDCAFCRSENEAEKQYGVIPEQNEIGVINREFVKEPDVRLNQPVIKIGRTTGRTQGRVTGIRATSFVNYGSEGTARFDRQIVIRGDGDFSAAGDSGSLILTDDNRPLGLLFAGGGQDTIANPFEFVVEELGIALF